jgi:hypothetical protein
MRTRDISIDVRSARHLFALAIQTEDRSNGEQSALLSLAASLQPFDRSGHDWMGEVEHTWRPGGMLDAS